MKHTFILLLAVLVLNCWAAPAPRSLLSIDYGYIERPFIPRDSIDVIVEQEPSYESDESPESIEVVVELEELPSRNTRMDIEQYPDSIRQLNQAIEDVESEQRELERDIARLECEPECEDQELAEMKMVLSKSSPIQDDLEVAVQELKRVERDYGEDYSECAPDDDDDYGDDDDED